MNTKGMKFLAVLAVFAMAFAAFAVVAPAETDDADLTDTTTATVGQKGLVAYTAGTLITGSGQNAYYFADDATVTVEEGATAVFFVMHGKTLTLNAVDNTSGLGTGASFALVAFVNVDSIAGSTLTFQTAKLSNDASYIAADPIATVNATTKATWGHEAWSWSSDDGTFTLTAPAAESTNFSIAGTNAGTTLDVYADRTVSGTIGTVVYKENVTVTYSDFTGTVKIGETIAVNLSGFSGSIAASDGVAKLNLVTWTAGNVEVTLGTLTQSAATLNIKTGSVLTVGAGSTYDATGTTLDNDGTIIVKATGGITVGDGFTNDGQLTNAGTITGDLTNNGVVTNTGEIAGTLTNNGAYEAGAGATVTTLEGNGIVYPAVINVSSENTSNTFGVNVAEINDDYTTLYYSQSEVVKVKSFTGRIKIS